jgi:hypothetical protein
MRNQDNPLTRTRQDSKAIRLGITSEREVNGVGLLVEREFHCMLWLYMRTKGTRC